MAGYLLAACICILGGFFWPYLASTWRGLGVVVGIAVAGIWSTWTFGMADLTGYESLAKLPLAAILVGLFAGTIARSWIIWDRRQTDRDAQERADVELLASVGGLFTTPVLGFLVWWLFLALAR